MVVCLFRPIKYGLPALVLLLSACSTSHLPPSKGLDSTSPQWQQRQQQLAKLHAFQLQGSLGYIGETRVYARFNWQQQSADRYRLLLTSTIGSSELQLDQQRTLVTIVDSAGQRHVSDNAQQLLTQLTGMQIPLDNLRQWMLGLPGNAQHYQLNTQAQLTDAEYQENGQVWRLKILSYNNKLQPALPEAMEVSTNQQRIKLHLDNWKPL